MKSNLPVDTQRWQQIAGGLAIVFAASGCATLPNDEPRPTVAHRDAAPAPLPTPSPSAKAPAVVHPYAAATANAVTVQPAPRASSPPAAEGLPIPVPIAVDPLRPEVRVDLADGAAHADLWARLRRGFALRDLSSELVQTHEQWYAARPEYVERMTLRGSRYLFHVVEEVERRGLPSELALLPFIESAFNPQAISSAKASGMWQFIPSTGKYFALKQNVFRDDRRDILASTRAALDYLEKLHSMFGDWHLALAAYNWGEGSVQRAIARNERAGLPVDYESLRMPAETQSYAPKLQAVKNIVSRPQDYNLTLPAVQNHPYFVSVGIDRDIDVQLAARLAGMNVDEFKTLNPQMNKPVILAAGTPQVLLPFDNAEAFAHRLTAYRGPLASWTAWVVPTTMRPSTAARQVGMSEDELRSINRIPMRMLVRGGSTLLVARADTGQADVSEHIADNAVMDLSPDVPPLRKIALRAGHRDTPASIARRFSVGVAHVAQWNAISSAGVFRKGQTVIVYVPVGAPVARIAASAPPVHHASVRPARPALVTVAAAAPLRPVVSRTHAPMVHAAAAAERAVGRSVARTAAQPKRPMAARAAPRRAGD